MNKEVLKGGIFVFLGACSFGVLSTVTKTAYAHGYTVGEITGTQSFFGMAILWLLYGAQCRLFPKTNNSVGIKASRTPLWKILSAGMCTGLVGIFYYLSIRLLPASMAIILLMQYLWITLLIEKIVFHKNPTRAQLIATVFVLVGTVFAGGLFDTTINLNIEGVVFGLLSATAYSIFLLTSGRVGTELPALKKSALMITGSCLLTWLIFPPLFFVNGVLIGGLYGWGILLALMGTVIPPLFFSIGIPKTGVALSAILSAVELPAAILAAYFILNEPVGPMHWLGVVLILLALILPNLKRRKKPWASPAE